MKVTIPRQKLISDVLEDDAGCRCVVGWIAHAMGFTSDELRGRVSLPSLPVVEWARLSELMRRALVAQEKEIQPEDIAFFEELLAKAKAKVAPATPAESPAPEPELSFKYRDMTVTASELETRYKNKLWVKRGKPAKWQHVSARIEPAGLHLWTDDWSTF